MVCIHIFIQNSWKWFQFQLKHVSSWSNMKNSTCAFMFQIWCFWSKFQFCTWNWLFGLHDKFFSFSIKSSHIFMKCSDHVQKISKFTFELSFCFKHLSFLSYLHVTLHLPQLLTAGEASKTDKMSSIHPNSKPSNVMDSIVQEEDMRKNSFWYFEFNQLWHYNPNSTVDQNLQISISQFLLI